MWLAAIDATGLRSDRPPSRGRLYPDSLRKRKYLAKSFRKDSCCRHDLRGIFEHDGTGRADRVGRNGLVEHRLARRANALALLDQGSDVGAALFLDDDTVRRFRLYSEEGTEGLAGFGYEGRDGHLKARQRDQLKCRDATAHDAPCRGVDRAGVRHFIKAARGWLRCFIDGAPHVAKARRGQTEGLHRGL